MTTGYGIRHTGESWAIVDNKSGRIVCHANSFESAQAWREHFTNDHALRRNLARMLAALGSDEYRSQRAEHLKRGRSPRTFRYAPSAFHAEACRILGHGSSADVARTIHADELSPYLGAAR